MYILSFTQQLFTYFPLGIFLVRVILFNHVVITALDVVTLAPTFEHILSYNSVILYSDKNLDKQIFTTF